ncbi:hypothetical protein [Halarchaeum sp. P4]
MPVPTYPSDEPDRRGGAPDIDDLIGRIIRGNDDHDSAPSPTCGA